MNLDMMQSLGVNMEWFTVRYIGLCNEWIQGRCRERIIIIMFYFNVIKQYLTLKYF